MDRGVELTALGHALREDLEAANRAREIALAACRRTIRACGSSIRAVHQLRPADALQLADEAGISLREAQDALAPFPALVGSGPLHDAAKEYAEARLTAAMVGDGPLPSARQLGVPAAAWLNGLAEAASELRRHLLDRLRGGELTRSESLLAAMDDAYGLLVTIDYPDAISGGLRRTTDSLRAVLERTRSDLTVTVLQSRLQAAIEGRSAQP
ncbi:MAG: haloacid dehalogenase [Actinomycetota bacterium]|nr:haloacid dehalogenase [Actinomycetota bacterium]